MALRIEATAVDDDAPKPPSATQRHGPKARDPLIALCFLFSGATSLVYQTAWVQEFALLFGATELAVVTVLAAFMGGLALGAVAAERALPRVHRPLLAYAVLEAGIALFALLLPFAMRAAAALQMHLFGGRATLEMTSPMATGAFYLASSFAILLVPTAAMGATLPLLVRGLVRTPEQIGRRVPALYALNTTGAAAGTLATAYLLLPTFGLSRTIWCAAAVNGLIAVVAVVAAAADRAVTTSVTPRDAVRIDRAARWILPVMLLSGAVSFTWEVLWTRLLVHLLGGSVYSFALMLATFLVGIALGSAIATAATATRRRALRAFALAQLAIGATSYLAFRSLDLVYQLGGFRSASDPGARGLLILAAVLLPSTMAIGATFPLAVRLSAPSAAGASAMAARIFASNTVGAIAGSLLTGYWLLPRLRFAGTATLAVLMSLALALFYATRTSEEDRAVGPRLLRRPVAVLAVAGVVLTVLRPLPAPWAILTHSPILPVRSADPDEVTYHAVGRSATVLLLEGPSFYRLLTNGLPESSIDTASSRPGRYGLARWLSLLPLACRPDARSLALVGLGAGVTITDLPPSIERIDVIELEPEVLRANQFVAKQRGVDPLADPRVSVHLNDARGALRLTEQRFDIVVSQPSHPWTSGASNLFTVEFLELVAQRLQPGGVLAQWMALPFVDESLLRSFVATANEVFDHVELYRPTQQGLILLASQSPLELEQRAPEALRQHSRWWAEVGADDPLDLIAARVLDGDGSRQFGAGAQTSTDRDNVFRLRSPRGLQAESDLGAISAALAAREPLTRIDDSLAVVRRLTELGNTARARRLATDLPRSTERAAALAWVDLVTGRPTAARRALAQALAADPTDPSLRKLTLLVNREQLARGAPAHWRLEPLSVSEGLIVDSWRLERQADWHSLRSRDDELATLQSDTLLAPWSRRLRAGWRVQVGGRAAGQEALELVLPLLGARPPGVDLLLAARAAFAAERHDLALGLIGESLDRLPAAQRSTIRTLLSDLRSEAAFDDKAARWAEDLQRQLDPERSTN